MADEILTPCNVARSWHWFRQVTAPCNVACGWCGSGIVILNSPKWQHPALWQVALMTCHWIRPNVHHIGILHLVSISTTSPPSTCHYASVSQILPTVGRKKITSCRFSRRRISAILDFRGPITGSLKSPCTTSYRSSETVALNCLVLWENRVFLHFGDRQTDRQTD